jgi:hypothetical protein
MSRAVSLWGATVLTIGIGYALLANDETTVAPVLLVIGYVILAPCAIRFGYNSECPSRMTK